MQLNRLNFSKETPHFSLKILFNKWRKRKKQVKHQIKKYNKRDFCQVILTKILNKLNKHNKRLQIKLKKKLNLIKKKPIFKR